MHKNKLILAALLCLCGMLCACAQTGGEASEEKVQKEIVQDQQNADEIKDEAEKEELQEEEDLQEGRELTAEELQAFGEYLSRGSNYGFLLSVYDTPADVNLDEVFYSGAGISTYEISEEEKQDYLDAVGQEEIYTDFEKITAASINDFLMEKTGLTYEQMNTTLGWKYLPEYDAYYSEHGDTNYREISCIKGYTVDEKEFVLQCSPREYIDSTDGYHKMKYELVVEKYGEEYRFKSNRLMWELGIIEEQSFDVALEPLGDVTFAAYVPDRESVPLADVSFSIIKDGWEVTRLWGPFSDNIRENDQFNEIEGIGFADYNKDGITDIIMVINYSVLSGSDKETSYSEVRVYQGEYEEYSYGESYYFQRYQQEVSETSTAALSEKTIRGVLDFLGN